MPKRVPQFLVKARARVKQLQSQLKKAEQVLKKAIAKDQKQVAKHSRRKQTSAKKSAAKHKKATPQRRQKKVSPKKKSVSPQRTLVETTLQAGDAAPLFTALTDDNASFSLQDYQGQWVVLYFYPKDDTPGCTKEAHDFTDSLDQFAAQNTIIVGVSRDSVTSHSRFKEKCHIGYTLLADTDETVCQRYGVLKNKMLYGKTVRGIERSTFLIDPQGIIHHIWRGVKVPGHVTEVLAAIARLN